MVKTPLSTYRSATAAEFGAAIDGSGNWPNKSTNLAAASETMMTVAGGARGK